MEYFASLTDMGLRRLYKFLLKRTIGKYLLKDITMDDINVASGDGLIKLYNLHLNPEALSDEIRDQYGFDNIPMVIHSAVVDEIVVFLSYTTILTESCRFELRGVRVTVRPNPIYNSTKSYPTEKEASVKTDNVVASNNDSNNKDNSGDCQSGLGFIANWIEIVVARLQVSIKDLDISFEAPGEDLSVKLSLRDIHFFNSSYDLRSKHETALDMSKRISSQQSHFGESLFTELSRKKTVRLGCIEVSLVSVTSQLDPIPILTASAESVVQLKIDQSSEGIDIDIALSDIRLQLQKQLVDQIVSVISSFCRTGLKSANSSHGFSSLSESVMKVVNNSNKGDGLQWLRTGEDLDRDEQINYRDVIEQIKQHQKEKYKNNNVCPDLSKSVLANLSETENNIQSDSDEDFPGSNSDSEDDAEFYDAIDNNNNKKPVNILKFGRDSVVNKSTYGKSTLNTMGSVIYHSVNNNEKGTDIIPTSYFRLRLHISSINVDLVDSNSGSSSSPVLTCFMRDSTISLSSTDYSNRSNEKKNNTKYSLSLNHFELFQSNGSESPSDKQMLLSIYSVSKPSSILCSPQVEVVVDVKFKDFRSSVITISVTIEPLVISIYYQSLIRWVDVLLSLVNGVAASDSLTNEIDIKIVIPQVDVIIHSDSNTSGETWENILNSINLNHEPWVDMLKNNKLLFVAKHFDNTMGGFHFQFKQLELIVSVNGLFDFELTMESMSVNAFINSKSQKKFYETLLFTATSSKGDKVKISKKSLSEIKFNNNLEDSSLFPTTDNVNFQNIIYVHAHQIIIDLSQREYNVSTIIFETLIEQSKHSASNNSSSSLSFKFVLTSQYSTITLSEAIPIGFRDLDFENQSQIKRNSDLFHNMMASEKKKLEETFSITASVRQPIIELSNYGNDLTISLKANDINIFEMNINQYISLLKENFDFHQKVITDLLRQGPDMHKIPFLYRSIFNMNNDKTDQSRVYVDTTLLPNNKYFGYIFDIRLILSQNSSNEIALFKMVSFYIDFYNMKISHDPKSVWLLKLVSLLSPKTGAELSKLRKNEIANYTRSHIGENTMFISLEGNKNAKHKSLDELFEMTKISARVRNCLVEYCCPDKSGNNSDFNTSRAVLSVDILTVSSNIVSNSDRYSLKFKAIGLDLHLNRQRDMRDAKVFELEIASSLSEYLQLQNFVHFLSIDHIENLVIFNNNSLEGLSLFSSLGTCLMTACVDSMVLFSSWFNEFQVSIRQNEKPLESQEAQEENISGSIDSKEKSIWTESIPDSVFENIKRDFEPSQKLSLTNRNLGTVNIYDPIDLDETLFDNYYPQSEVTTTIGHKSNFLDKSTLPEEEIEEEARWIPCYNYDDNSGIFDVEDNSSDTSIITEPVLGATIVVQEKCDESYNSPSDSEDEDGGENNNLTKSIFGIGNLSYFGLGRSVQPTFEEFELDNLLLKGDKFQIFNNSEAMTSLVTNGETWLSEIENWEESENEKCSLSNESKVTNDMSVNELADNISKLSSESRVSPTDIVQKSSQSDEVERKIIKMINETDIPSDPTTERLTKDDLDIAWASTDDSNHHQPNLCVQTEEQLAFWYLDPDSIEIQTYYIPLDTAIKTVDDCRPDSEKTKFTKLLIKIDGSLRIKLVSGNHWDINKKEEKKESKIISKEVRFNEIKKISRRNKTLKKEPLFSEKKFASTDTSKNNVIEKSVTKIPQRKGILEIVMKGIFMCIRVYDDASVVVSNNIDSETGNSDKLILYQRVSVSAQDIIISFNENENKKRKVFGVWASSSRPKLISQPFLQSSLVTYEDKSNTLAALESRLYIDFLPIRSFLDDSVVSFVKDLLQPFSTGPKSSNDSGDYNNNPSPSIIYFQCVTVSSIEMKINYKGSSINLNALHNGDYLQLLNIFPLDGLELVLKSVQIKGVTGLTELSNKLLETWVNDIYSNQLHKILSGTTPFKGLSNVGYDLSNLISIPMSDYKKYKNNGEVMRHVSKGAQSLFKTITRETLDFSHKMTMFVANAITELASTDSEIKSITNNLKIFHESNSNKYSSKSLQQPKGVIEGLTKAYDCVSKELSTARETILAVPFRQYQRSGPGGYIKSIVRAIPVAILKSSAGVVEGLSYTILGLRNNFDPSIKQDEEDIWNVDLKIED